MKKGCIIAIVVVLVLGLIVGGVVVWLGISKGIPAANSSLAFGLEKAIEAYQSANPDAQIPATNEAWAEALKGTQMPAEVGGANISDIIVNGKLIDMMQNPFHIEQGADGTIRVISVGKDGEAGTEDDVDSSMMRGLLEGA